MSSEMEFGLYEQLLTRALHDDLAPFEPRQTVLAKVDPEDAPHVLARHVSDIVEHRLRSIRDDEQRLRVIRDLLATIKSSEDDPVSPAQMLESILEPEGPGGLPRYTDRPGTPLTEAALLTNAPGDPSLGAELRREIDSCDEIDLLCAFVKWHGVRLLEEPLRRARQKNIPLRVITTTYVGATERLAIERLIRDFGAEVKVSYDSQRTRLHAKSWLFRRNTGFHTAYVGSSNLSKTALLEGVEWNVRLSAIANKTLMSKFQMTFDRYWNDPSYELYDPERDRDRLDDALAEAAGQGTGRGILVNLSGLEVRPFPYQQRMLDDLQAERDVHDRHRNLVVAATGTGKTVVAALDYRRLCEAGKRPRLLFVAHRKEILEQSLRTYREVLADANFGEFYVDGKRPERWQHVFATVQSLMSYGATKIPSDAFDILVIDEFHHAEARTYRRLVEHLTPHELLGLTATPERADGTDVRQFFDGRTATELRLWDALGAELLSPFHYFAVADGTDLRSIEWKRGRYDEAALSDVFTGNDARARIVLSQLRDKVLDMSAMRCVGFCVSVAHAEYMAQVFSNAGIPAVAVSGRTSTIQRERALDDLRQRRVNALFAADLFNEGLDVPQIDTVLFLRPTESATIFLQQLGRGLRRTHDKAVLTVLDFVGHHRKEFRFDQKLRALTGETRAGLLRNIGRGFPFLPSGCQIVMDKQSQELVVENIKAQVGNTKKRMVAELRSYGEHDLATFLHESGLELSDVLRRGDYSWTQLRLDAGLPVGSGTPEQTALLKRVRALAHVDDPDRHSAYRGLLSDDAPAYADLSTMERRLADMLFFSIWPGGGGHTSIGEGLDSLRAEQAVRAELRDVIDLAFDETRHLTTPLAAVPEVPLRVHGSYQREEVLAALGYASLGRKPNSFMEGVLYVPELNVDALFVTLQKSEAEYSPTTMYRDYWISPGLFHWESQSTTSQASRTGQRYVNGTSTVLLFVREAKRDVFGTAPYVCVGPVHRESHTGERPIAITWAVGATASQGPRADVSS